MKTTLFTCTLLSLVLCCCSEKKIPYKDRQNATEVILNAFSVTDASIKSLSYQSDVIVDVLPGGGQKMGGYGLAFHQTWNITLVDTITAQKKDELILYLRSLEDPYRQKMKIRHDEIPDYEYKFSVEASGEKVKVRVDASYE